MESASKSENTVVPMHRERPALFGVPGHADRALSIPVLKDRVASLMTGSPSVPEVALCVVSVLQQIVIHESERYQFDEALEETLHHFAADGFITEAFRSLFFQAKGVLQDSLHRREVAHEIGGVLLDELGAVIDWYGQRSNSIRKISGDEKLLKPGTEGFFDLRALHDKERFGAYGAEIRTGLLLDSRGGETLWLRAQILFRGKYLAARKGWESWTVQDGDESFAIEVPLVCRDSKRIGRTIIDALNFFIPYGALAWPEDVQGKAADISIILGVFNRAGQKLFSQVQLETLRVMHDASREPNLVSPQSAEVWESCPVNGHSLNRLQMYWIDDEVGGNIEVSFNAVLFGLAGKEVTACVRVLDCDGNGIHTVNESVSDPYGYYANEFLLSISTVVARFNDLVSTINPKDLVLTPGINSLRLEVTLKNESDRVLCGIVEPFTINFY